MKLFIQVVYFQVVKRFDSAVVARSEKKQKTRRQEGQRAKNGKKDEATAVY